MTDITQRDLEEIFELRIMFEMHALHTACRYFDEETLERLERGFQELDENSTPQQYEKANRNLHSAIIAYGGNKRVEKFYKQLSAQIAIVTRISARAPEVSVHAKEQHLEILKDLKRRDQASAEKHLFQHLNEVRDRTIRQYAEPFIYIKGVAARK